LHGFKVGRKSIRKGLKTRVCSFAEIRLPDTTDVVAAGFALHFRGEPL
jgi:hypothetical protein